MLCEGNGERNRDVLRFLGPSFNAGSYRDSSQKEESGELAADGLWSAI